MANITTGVFHSLGAPAFRITGAPIDIGVGWSPMESTPLEFRFITRCMYSYDFVDERGVTHIDSNGLVLQTEPKWRIRFKIEWNTLRSCKIEGGNVRRMIEDTGEFEFLMYLLNHYNEFSYNGSSSIQFIMDYQSDLEWTETGQEKAFDVCLLSPPVFGEYSAEAHTASIILVTKDYIDKIPYTLTYNKSLYT